MSRRPSSRRDGLFTPLAFCKRGHPRTPENIYSGSNRTCKVCKRMLDAKRRRRLGRPVRLKTEHVQSEPDPFGWWQPNRRRSA